MVGGQEPGRGSAAAAPPSPVADARAGTGNGQTNSGARWSRPAVRDGHGPRCDGDRLTRIDADGGSCVCLWPEGPSE